MVFIIEKIVFQFDLAGSGHVILSRTGLKLLYNRAFLR